MPTDNPSTPPESKNISIGGDVVDSVVIAGDNNQTFFQKIVNIFKSDAETLEQRNRRILLNHVENAWIKGVLDASLHGAALMELGIKEDPDAVKKYPWTIKKEATNETLPEGTSMLEIFESIGLGRSLLILGAPGSGKTTMLLELTRQLIARAREDVTQPIPIVFNLASWTEKLSLTDWLAQELNTLYSVPRKTAPDWVKSNKLLLLLDGLDEVRQESGVKCVEAINEFRNENGLTSLAVCSRNQDYEDLEARLSFEGAIEVQPLTQEQIAAFFKRFGNEITGIKRALEKDSALREMAETPLFLSIMFMAYRDKQAVEILVSGDEKAQRQYLFDTYIDSMFQRRSENMFFKKQAILRWLSWLAHMMVSLNDGWLFIENLKPKHLHKYKDFIGDGWFGGCIMGLCFGVIFGLAFNLYFGLIFGLVLGFISGNMGFGAGSVISVNWRRVQKGVIGNMGSGMAIGLIGGLISLLNTDLMGMLIGGMGIGLIFGGIVGLIYWAKLSITEDSIINDMVNDAENGTRNFMTELLLDKISENRVEDRALKSLVRLISNIIKYAVLFFLLFASLLAGVFIGGLGGLLSGLIGVISAGWLDGLLLGITFGTVFSLVDSLDPNFIRNISYPGQNLIYTARNSALTFLVLGGLSSLGISLIVNFHVGVVVGLSIGLFFGWHFGGSYIFQHYVARFILIRNKLLPWKLIPFLDHCVDLIFLRRVGGGYIFVHRLLMEHFAEMDEETINRLAAG